MAPHPSTSNGGSSPATLQLNNQLMTRLKPAKVFKNAIEPAQPPPTLPNQPLKPPTPRSITGISFDDRGDTVVTAAEDEAFKLYSCKNGRLMKTLYSKKYGVDLPRFTHKSSTIIHASTKEDDTIRYHALHDNKYLQYFRGHKGKVISLEVSPVDDGFISGSNDKTVRLWDLRTPACRGLLSLPSPPVVAYDPSGIIFAVAVNPYARILLYDQANFDKAPFLTIHVNDPGLMFMTFPPRQIYITSLSFSPDAKLILVGCSGGGHYVLDAFKGSVLAKLEGHVGLERTTMNVPHTIEATKGISGEEVSWTPDCKYVVSGSLDGRVFVWDIQNLPQLSEAERAAKSVPRVQPISSLEGHPGPSRCVRFNPRFAMMCVAGTELAFWLPDTSPDSEESAKDLLKKKGMT